MPAYVIVNVIIHNEIEYKEYTKLTPATIHANNGKFIVRGGGTEVLEGQPNLGRVVVLEFPDAARAKEWWSSPEYGEAKVIRQRTATTEMFIVDGYTAP